MVEEERAKVQIACDYNNGKWIPDKLGPIYNGTNCGIVTNYQDCMTNGRPDLVYLHWKWKPNQCNIPRFEPKVFLQSSGTNTWLSWVIPSLEIRWNHFFVCWPLSLLLTLYIVTTPVTKRFVTSFVAGTSLLTISTYRFTGHHFLYVELKEDGLRITVDSIWILWMSNGRLIWIRWI